jgi:hypothetical protein
VCCAIVTYVRTGTYGARGAYLETTVVTGTSS